MPAEPVDRVDQMPAVMWERGMVMVHHSSVCPWISMVDETKFRAEVAKLAGLGIEVIVGSARCRSSPGRRSSGRSS